MIRILHVDDNVDDLELIGIRLKRLSKELDINPAQSPRHAMDLLGESRFDCILCDYQMPGSSGFDFLEALRSRGDETPFIFLTGQGNEELAARALRAGADDYYTKELTFAHYDRLLNSIMRVVEARKDVERKRQAETALRESEGRYRNLVERAQDGIVLIQDRTIKFANSSLAMMLGHGIEDLVGEPFIKYVYREEIPKLLDRYERRISGDPLPSAYETALLRSDGSIIHVELNAGLITYEGEPADLVMVRDVTERRRMEEALRESEERFRSLVENINEVIFTTDMRGVLTYISPVIEQISGLKVKEIVGKPFRRFIHPGDASSLEANVRRGMKGLHEPIEIRVYDANGIVRHVLISNSIIRKDGKPVGITGVLTDISERKRAELIQSSVYKISDAVTKTGNLQELYGRIHSIVGEMMPAENFYIAFYDYGKKLIRYPYFVDQFDETPDPEPPGKTLTGYVLRYGQPLLASPEKFDELAAQGEVERVGTVPIDWLGVPLRTRGATIGVLVVQSYTEGLRYGEEEKDILMFVSSQVAMAIERKRAEEELREQEQKFRKLYERSNDMIFLHETDGRIIDVNIKALELLGYSRGELLEMTFQDLVPPTERGELDSAMKKLGKDKSLRVEVSLARKDGEVIPTDISAILTEVGGRTMIQSIGRDITKRIHADRDAVSYRERLEEQALLLSSTNRELKAFAYSVSHDLKKPLRHIDGYCQILEEEYAQQLDTQAHEYLSRVRSAIDRMHKLIDDLLKLSQMSGIELKRSKVNISELAREIADGLKQENPERDAEFLIEDGMTADSDPQMMRLVFENLLGNSWKFTSKEKSARIELGIQKGEQRGVFFVRDNGVGFDQNLACDLFSPFRRLHREGEFEGSGIGLATVQRIIHRHDGFIWAKGEPGEGATFYFTLG
ncbi:MAG TPA: PAS domain S-box protein [Acidobacteriota bacterium]|nr:PAS domain S-box protein [Acidobacteriota bacterium]